MTFNEKQKKIIRENLLCFLKDYNFRVIYTYPRSNIKFLKDDIKLGYRIKALDLKKRRRYNVIVLPFIQVEQVDNYMEEFILDLLHKVYSDNIIILEYAYEQMENIKNADKKYLDIESLRKRLLVRHYLLRRKNIFDHIWILKTVKKRTPTLIQDNFNISRLPFGNVYKSRKLFDRILSRINFPVLKYFSSLEKPLIIGLKHRKEFENYIRIPEHYKGFTDLCSLLTALFENLDFNSFDEVVVMDYLFNLLPEDSVNSILRIIINKFSSHNRLYLALLSVQKNPQVRRDLFVDEGEYIFNFEKHFLVDQGIFIYYYLIRKKHETISEIIEFNVYDISKFARRCENLGFKVEEVKVEKDFVLIGFSKRNILQ